MPNYSERRLGDLAAPFKTAMSTGPFGSSVSAKNFRACGFPMLRGGNLSEDVGVRLDETNLVYLEPELAAQFKRSWVTSGDLIFTCWGTVGQIGLIDERAHYEHYVISNKQMKRTPDRERVDSRFLYYLLSQQHMVDLVKSQAIGSSVPGFNLGQLKEIHINCPPLSIQRAIAEVLGALDDKIAANAQTVQTSALLGLAVFSRATAHGSEDQPLTDLSLLIARGITPSYTDDANGTLVLNQKCVRGQRVNVGPGRPTLLTRTRSEKMLIRDDVLVNSTGQGTLGRVARWTGTTSVTVDSHITIVRFDPRVVNSVCAGYAMLSMQGEIEAMGEGSTGQTELSRTELAKLLVRLPTRSEQDQLGATLNALSDAEDSLIRENSALAAMRDTLLPSLMSGKLRVKDAEKQLDEVL